MPALKRGLKGGEVGKDVQGVQRAVYAARSSSGESPRNGRTGTYGEHTIADVKAWQRRVGIDATGNTGQPTLDSLWPSMDAYGRSLYFKAKIGQAPALPHGELCYGWSGDRVRALQQMLWRALESASVNARNATFGQGVSDDLALFAEVADLNPEPDDRACEQGVWEMLYGFADAYARDLAQDAGGEPAGVRSELVTHAEWYTATGGRYLQARPYQGDVPARTPLENDCSGSIHHLFKLAGGPDPSGRGFDGQGLHGHDAGSRRAVDLGGALLAGDCVFYGDQGGGIASHVAMMLDASRLFTFGSTPPTITAFASYWTSRAARRYRRAQVPRMSLLAPPRRVFAPRPPRAAAPAARACYPARRARATRTASPVTRASSDPRARCYARRARRRSSRPTSRAPRTSSPTAGGMDERGVPARRRPAAPAARPIACFPYARAGLLLRPLRDRSALRVRRGSRADRDR